MLPCLKIEKKKKIVLLTQIVLSIKIFTILYNKKCSTL
jgi:hypothetical protein